MKFHGICIRPPELVEQIIAKVGNWGRRAGGFHDVLWYLHVTPGAGGADYGKGGRAGGGFGRGAGGFHGQPSLVNLCAAPDLTPPHPAGEAGRHPAHHGRPDRAEPGQGALGGGVAVWGPEPGPRNEELGAAGFCASEQAAGGEESMKGRGACSAARPPSPAAGGSHWPSGPAERGRRRRLGAPYVHALLGLRLILHAVRAWPAPHSACCARCARCARCAARHPGQVWRGAHWRQAGGHQQGGGPRPLCPGGPSRVHY